ncbi:MAG TPA: VWA domain-containing protein [Negativicutes bacterium]|nr:VWA domain-containing protein [Negativicutes bacterium]
MGRRLLFPFAAVVGQADVKEALLIALVNPKTGGLLVAGEKGSAKSVLVRALAQVDPAKKIVELPLNATEDQVFGAIDLEQAMTCGRKVFSPGLLAHAHEQVLYVDEINLLRREVLTGILEAVDRGVNAVEREGISHRHEVRLTLIGTMNPEEGTLTPAILDRFGMFVAVQREMDVKVRADILRRVLAYEQDAVGFVAQYHDETEQLVQRCREAHQRLGRIEIDPAMMQLAAQYCTQANSAGHRAELYLLEVARTIAALAEREYLLPADMERAAYFVLPHRMRQEDAPPPPPPEAPSEQPEDQEPPQDQDSAQDPPPPPPPTDDQQAADPPPDKPDEADEPPPPNNGEGQERTADIDRNFSGAKLQVTLPQDRQARQGSGKRSLTRTDLKQGRYVRAILPPGTLTDLAFDATLRAAAPYQSSRPKGRCAIAIHKADLRQKVREKRIGNIFLFVVDASGSMGARERMKMVKGAIFTMLQDVYQKRDQVGLIAFRRKTAEVLLPVTRSVDLAQKCLATLPTGGKTPLAEGLDSALMLLRNLRKKDKNSRPILVLITDGRANSSDGGDPIAAALSAAEKIGRTGIPSVVIDTESDFISLAVARQVARSMGSTYYQLQELSEAAVVHIVQNALSS